MICLIILFASYIISSVFTSITYSPKYNIPSGAYILWSICPILNVILLIGICRVNLETAGKSSPTVVKPQDVVMFNTGSLKVNGQKIARTIKFGEVPNNSYVILDEDSTASKTGNLLFKSDSKYFVDLTLGVIYSNSEAFDNKKVKFVNVELNFAPVKDE